MNLKPRTRKAVLTVHIAAAGAWIGIDVMVACLVLVGRTSDDPGTRGLAYQALAEFVVLPMFVSGVVCLTSGVLLGLATKWGLIRYWWVLVKLVMNVVLCVLILVALRPGMPEVASYGADLAAGRAPTGDVSGLVFPPTVSLTALTIATLLSVYKPWGRVRRTRRDVGRSGRGPVADRAARGARRPGAAVADRDGGAAAGEAARVAAR